MLLVPKRLLDHKIKQRAINMINFLGLQIVCFPKPLHSGFKQVMFTPKSIDLAICIFFFVQKLIAKHWYFALGYFNEVTFVGKIQDIFI